MLEIDSVTLTFWDKKILSGCYLNCRQGEIVGMLGRNGTGKSSLLKIIFGSINADFKHLKINGKLIDKGFKSNLIAYLPQESFLPPFLPATEIIKQYMLENQLSVGLQLLEKVNGLKTGELSGGELKLVEFLWILNLRTPYILLDEPFSGISPIYVEVLQDLIRNISKTRGIILTDHLYRPLLEISNRIVLLHNNAVYTIKKESDLVHYNYIPDYL